MHYDLCCTVIIWKSPTWAGFFGLLGYQMLTKPEEELPCSDGYLPYIIFMRFWRLYQLNLGLKWLECHCILFIWHLMQHLNIFVCKNKESGFAWIKWNHISQARFVHRDLVVVFLSAYIRWPCASKDYYIQLPSLSLCAHFISRNKEEVRQHACPITDPLHTCSPIRAQSRSVQDATIMWLPVD